MMGYVGHRPLDEPMLRQWLGEAEHWLLSPGVGMLGMPDARAVAERRIILLVREILRLKDGAA